MFYFTILNDINIALKNNGLEEIQSINYSDYSDFDYQSNLFFKYFKHPDLKKIQSSIIKFLEETNHYSKIQITGKGFLSLKINPSINSYPVIEPYKKEKIIIDYCGVNVAKKMHIGHIRSMFIGDYILKHNLFMGNEVVCYNHIGDWGNQFGYLIAYIKLYYNEDINLLNNKELTNIYKKAYSLYNSSLEFKEISNNTVISLYNKDKDTVLIWNKICQVSIKELNHITNFFKLGISEKNIQGESFYFDLLPQIEKELLSKKIIYEENGALIFQSQNNKSLILKKSNGSYLYPMYDLAAIHWRIHNINPDKIIYVVDKRQSLYFKQIFEIAQLSEWKKTCSFEHIEFGFITDDSGQPLKTKSGESIYLDEQIVELEQLIKSQPYFKNQKSDINKELTNSLKIFELSFKNSSDYHFNINNIYNEKGSKWNYISYTITQLENLINNLSPLYVDEKLFLEMLQKDTNLYNLFLKNEQLKEILLISFNSFQSHLIIDFIFSLCDKFNSLKENKQLTNISLNLLTNIHSNILNAISILGCI